MGTMNQEEHNMLKNLTIGKKLALGFGVVLVLLTLTGVIAFRGVRGLGASAQDVVAKNTLAQDLAQKEIDHLNWAKAVSALITDEDVTTLNVQTDDHQCAFGQWLYGEGRQKAEKQIPELAEILKAIEEPHHRLHQSATKMESVYEPGEAALSGLLAARMVDHLKWADVIRTAFLNDQDSIQVETDPTRCALGRWFASPEGQKAYAEANDELKAVWDQTLKVHLALHESAVEICQCFSDGPEGKVEALQLFDMKTLPLLTETLGGLEKMKEIAEHVMESQNEAAGVFTTETEPALHEVQELLGQAIDAVSDVVDHTNANVTASARSIQWYVAGLSIAAVVLGLAAAFFIAQGIIVALKRIIVGLRTGSEQVAAASGQVSAASQSLAEGATEQAAGLEETSSSLEEMASMTKQNADSAQQANTLAFEARKAADTGSQAMTRMNAAIQEIQKSSDETAKIIKVIDEIAFQTNLLALNAAVEAARAGEAGKGFAVVAEEVRNLAMRSAEAAKNTASMIEESVKNSKNGVDIASEVGKVLDEIVGSIGKTTDLVSEIAAASSEQAQGIDQVNIAVAQMDKVTQQNAANAEESASASEELSSQAESMNDIVGELVRLVGGATKDIAKTEGRRKRGAKLSRSDTAWHQIARGTGDSPAVFRDKAKSPEYAIPLDEHDDDFDTFNG